MRQRRLDLWLPSYVRGAFARRRLRARRRDQLTHVLFLVCDHFEPRHGAKRPEQPAERMAAWRAGYAQMQAQCLERFGTRPLHSWFYPPHHGSEHLAALAEWSFMGLGEVELHFHHDGDTEETLRSKLRETLAEFRRAGLLLQQGEPPVERFGFIHGDWALDNAGGHYCGVNSELDLLQELGCWGDLTMPSANQCQTRKINSIYYAVDDPARPKSHDSGQDARVGVRDAQGLLLIQGPLAVNFKAPGHPRVENASLTSSNWGRPDRIRAWLDCHVHVEGRPEWMFVKLHTHGAIEQDFDALFGKKALEMHRVMAQELNDGKRYRLHYVTARQAFNVIRAAEAGLGGDPSRYYDYELAPQVTSAYCLNVPHQLASCTRERLVVGNIERSAAAIVQLAYSKLRKISGALSSCTVDERAGTAGFHLHGGAGEAIVELADGAPVRLENATVRASSGKSLTLDCTGPVTLQW